jgi:RNA polymerase sigma-70 factor (ECF subfamily)
MPSRATTIDASLLGVSAPSAALRDAWRQRWEAARNAWPDVPLDEEAFEVEAAAHAKAASPPRDPLEWLGAVAFDDLYLAVACGLGVPRALYHFETHHTPRARVALGRLGLTASEIDEAAQALREELLIPPLDGRPRILRYQGRGTLSGWVRAIAVRVAYRTVKRPVREVELDEATLTAEGPDPEVLVMKRTYAEVVRAAFARALAGMSTEDRLLLKQRFVHGLTCDELAAMYGMHRATAARRVSDLRGKLVAATREDVTRELDIARGDFSTLLRLVRTELRLAMSTLDAPSDRPDR